MNILCVTPWKNTWIGYWSDFFKQHGHTSEWLVSEYVDQKALAPHLPKYDAILCHWADKWAIQLSALPKELNPPPLYVILRSYEIFTRSGWADLTKITWSNVRRFFMLNEEHAYAFKCRVKGVEPTFIKNGIDLSEWGFIDRPSDALSRLGWICDVNEKKGVELAVQAVAELHKVNPSLTFHHLGRNQDLRRFYYLERILPHLGVKFDHHGWKNDHTFVNHFLGKVGFVLSSSIAEGNPMNILEAMATGAVPLVHRWPGAQYQFPEKWLWSTFDELRAIYERNLRNYEGLEARRYAEEHYDYRKTYLPVLDAIQADVKVAVA